MREFFKIVITRYYGDNGEVVALGDIVGFSINSIYQLSYKIREWTEPVIPGSKLFVFGSLEDAKHFADMNGYSTDSIYKCEVRGEPIEPPRISWYSNDIVWFWKQIRESDSWPIPSRSTARPPKGTFLVDAVMLTEPVS